MNQNLSAIDSTRKQGYKEDQTFSKDFRAVNLYKFLDDAYTGLGGFSGKTFANGGEEVYSYIHAKKTENSYKSRVKRAVYRNMHRPFVDAQYKPLFVDDPATVVKTNDTGAVIENHPYQVWTENVDGAGLSKNQYMSNALKAGYKDAVTYLVMDKAEGELEPYVYTQQAHTVDNDMLIVDRHGRLQQIAFIVQEEKELYRRTTWTNDDVTIETSKDCKEWELVSKTPLSVSKMPVYPMFTVDRENPRDYLPFPAESYAVAVYCVGIYNQSCQRTWHSVMQSVGSLMLVDMNVEQINEAYTNAMEATSHGEKTPQAFYISADTGIAANLKEDELDMIAGLIDLMAESGVVLTQSQYDVPESGAARLYRFRGQEAKLKYSRRVAVNADKWMQEMYKEYQGGGEWVATTLYPTSFAIQEPVSLVELRELFLMYKDAGYTENMKSVLVEIVKQIAGDSENSKILMEEIESYNPTPAAIEA
jgi:hypothetical protein